MNRCKKIPEYLLPWYQEHARDLPWRTDKNPYHVWLSEIMLQQTRVEAVKAYYIRFLEALPTIADLAQVEEERLLKLWEGLGYYNRAKNLKKAAITVMEDYQGIFPDTYEEILSLSGIGEYTAGAIASICFERPTPAVDGNVLRVYARVMEDFSNIDKQSTKRAVRDALEVVYLKGKCGLFTQSLMELGATVCVPNGVPKCELCPLQSICLARKNDTWSKLPVREEKKKRKIEYKTVFMLQCGDKIAIRKRTEKGLLAGMWEYPNITGTCDEQQAADVVTAWKVNPRELQKSMTYTHVFTHVEWHMKAYYFQCDTMTEEFVWVTQEELEKTVAIPSAFRGFEK
jgi:A/G-specific adenine glycosylase